MTTVFLCDRCNKETLDHGKLFEVRLLSRDDCKSIPSGLLFGLQGEYCEPCAKEIQRILQEKKK
jgi:hypothetical protein